MVCVSFGRETWITAIKAPCFSLMGHVCLSACFRDAFGSYQASQRIFQASAIHLQAATVTGVQMATVNAMVSIGSIVFSSLNTPSQSLSENNSPI